MKTFTKMAAQGDFIIIRVDEIPESSLGPSLGSSLKSCL